MGQIFVALSEYVSFEIAFDFEEIYLERLESMLSKCTTSKILHIPAFRFTIFVDLVVLFKIEFSDSLKWYYSTVCF